jgi:hypothetical protein
MQRDKDTSLKTFGKAWASYEKQANKIGKHIEFKIDDFLWFNIQDFKMPKALASWFLLKYIKLYKVCYKLDPNVYTLLLQTTFVAHSTFHVFKLKLFNKDKRRLNKKQA